MPEEANHPVLSAPAGAGQARDAILRVSASRHAPSPFRILGERYLGANAARPFGQLHTDFRIFASCILRSLRPLICGQDFGYVLDMSGLRYPPDEIARLGELLFERDVLPRINGQNRNDIVAIDIESGAYVIDPDQLTAADRLLAQNPDAQIWFRRVGWPYVDSFSGFSRLRSATHD